MSVKIEILDYKYDDGDNLVDVNAASSGIGSGLWSVNTITSVDWNGNSGGSGVTYLSNISSFSLVVGQTYNLSFEITNKTGTNNMGFSSSSGVGTSARLAGNGTISHTFVATDASFPDLFAYAGNTGTVSKIKITNANAVDWEYSVVGELDVTDHSDFPLAMTFQISDIKDLTSTTGDYSKTFKIPATKHNNKLLKHNYIANIKKTADITENKRCRIMVNNLYSLVGLIRVTGIGGYGETPSYYDCVFYGSNVSWADGLSEKYMNELEWGSVGEGLTYTKASIMDTWQDEHCDSSTSPLVYPIVSYGDYNQDGMDRTIQLLDTKHDHYSSSDASEIGYYGFFDNGDAYETPLPSPDWRPAIFVKTTIDKIFSQEGLGYKLSSTFMETDMFKRLVWSLPNFKYNNVDERQGQYSLEADFAGTALSALGLAATFSTDAFQLTWDNDNVELGALGTDFTYSNNTVNTDITYTGGSDSYFTIQEFGYYQVAAKELSATLKNLLQDGATPDSDYWSLNGQYERFAEFAFDRIQFRLQVKTAGQTSWNDLDLVEDTTSKFFLGSSLAAVGGAMQNFSDGDGIIGGAGNQYVWSLDDDLVFSGWLNKNDRIRIVFYARFGSHETRAHILGGGGSGTWDGQGDWTFDAVPSIGELDILINPNNVEYGQTYNLQDVMNPDYKQLDFVKGIAHAFNLKMTTDETTKTITIEPFDTFYKDYAEAIDWTYKLDRVKEIEDNWAKSDLKRDVVFKYKSDSKDKNVESRGERYFDGVKDEYPYQERLPKTFEKGESIFENPFFAGTFNAKDQDNRGLPNLQNPLQVPYSGCLWTEVTSPNYSTRPEKGFDFLPRLLYWNKYSPAGALTLASGLFNKWAKVQTWANVEQYIVASDAQPAISDLLSKIYPQATSINFEDSASPVLSYGNVTVRDYNDTTGAYSAGTTGKGLFETYYKNMFEMMKGKPRLRTVYIDLKVTDIVNLDFSKLVYIDGVYWRLSRVVDYQPNKNKSTKVELIEWLQLGAFAASAPAFDGWTNPWAGWNPYDGSMPDDSNNNMGI